MFGGFPQSRGRGRRSPFANLFGGMGGMRGRGGFGGRGGMGGFNPFMNMFGGGGGFNPFMRNGFRGSNSLDSIYRSLRVVLTLLILIIAMKNL